MAPGEAGRAVAEQLCDPATVRSLATPERAVRGHRRPDRATG